MKKPLFLLLVPAVLFLASPAGADPKNITTISMDQISQLEAMHQQATDLLIKNDFQGALRAYSDILLTEPDDETAYTGLGQIYLVLGQVKKAHEAFQNALHIDPYNEVALDGIQKIMDPDGVEGMVNRAQAEGLNEAPLVEPGWASAAKTNPRQGPVSPVQRKAKIAPTKKRAPRGFRLGLLNAQRIQMCLKNAGVYAGPVNGRIGTHTRQAVLKFQKLRGLDETGIADNDTRPALLAYLVLNER